ERQVIDARDVDIDFPIAVDVGHRDAGLPPNRIGDASLVGDVLELIVALIAIELVRAEVRGEVEVGETVSVDIADGNSGAVVVVQVVQDVEVGALGQIVGEGYAGRFWLQELEERPCRRVPFAPGEGDGTKQNCSPGRQKTPCCGVVCSCRCSYFAGVKRSGDL